MKIKNLKKPLTNIINNIYHLPASVPRLMIEVTDKCNLSCPFCSNKDIQRKKHDIPDDIFYKAIDQYVEMGGKVLRPYSTGEPFMCRNFLDYISYSRKKGLEIRFTSNGQLLTEKNRLKMLEIGVQNINISAEGLNRTEYESARIGGSFDKLRDNLSSFLQMRNSMGLTRPSIRIQTVLFNHQENKLYMEAFKHTWTEYCDSVIFAKNGTQGGNQTVNCNIVDMKDRMTCNFFFDLLCVNNDGTVSCCCVDYGRKLVVGDLKRQSLLEIWNSKKLVDFRKLARKKSYEKIASVCTFCSSISRSSCRNFKKLNDN